jgi:hypothetical protein
MKSRGQITFSKGEKLGTALKSNHSLFKTCLGILTDLNKILPQSFEDYLKNLEKKKPKFQKLSIQEKKEFGEVLNALLEFTKIAKKAKADKRIFVIKSSIPIKSKKVKNFFMKHLRCPCFAQNFTNLSGK